MFLQTYTSSILKVLNIDENSLQIQRAINISDQFHSSLCRKKIFRGLNTLLYSNIHSSGPYLEPSWTLVGHLRQKFFAKIGNNLNPVTIFAKTSTVDVPLGSKHPYL